jgi:hypothetical protein
MKKMVNLYRMLQAATTKKKLNSMKPVFSWFRDNWLVIVSVGGWFAFITFLAIKFGVN